MLLRHHLALAARLYEILPDDKDADALVGGMEEPGKSAALVWLASLRGYYNMEDGE